MRIMIGTGTRSAYMPNPLPLTDIAVPGYFVGYVPVRIELIRTGETIRPGIIPAKLLARGFTELNENFTLFNVNMTTPWNITILQPTCSATIPNQNIDLGEVSIADFNTQGRTTPANFSIDLDCTGVAGTTDVYVTLTDASYPSNTTTQLNLSPDSDALGIALEVHNRYGVVSFGPDLSGTGNPGQWFDGIAGIGSYSIPLSVNYVRLPGPIKGGSANSGVTYTLNYD